MSTSKKKKLKTVGHIEKIDFIDGDVSDVDCKIDTGADSCAVHCDRIVMRVIDGVDHLCFVLLDRKDAAYSGVEVRTPDFKEKKVKSSIGDFEYRYQVKLRVRFFGEEYLTSFNLSNRDHMKYPVLIGRKLLNNRFLVDVHQKYLSTKS